MPGVYTKPRDGKPSARMHVQRLSLGHAVTPPTCNAVAMFGPVKFSPDQQSANPDKPMTRVVKDVLRVGRWNIGGTAEPSMLDVDDEFLTALAESVRLQQSSGHAINLTLSHGDAALTVDSTDIYAPIDAAAVNDGVLWVASYVTPNQAKQLSNPACKVSPGFQFNYVDGSGLRHPLALLHVAVVDRPVVGGQGPFVVMANASPTQGMKGKSMDFALLKEAINAILAAGNLGALADDVNEQNIVERLTGMASVIKAMSGASPDDPAAPEADPAAGGEGMANALTGAVGKMSNSATIQALIERAVGAAVKPLQQQVVAMSNELRAHKAGAVKNAREAFDTEVRRLGASGVSAAVLQEKIELAATAGWDMRLLNGLTPTVSMSNTGKAGATADPPRQGAGGDKPRDRSEIVKELAAKRGITTEAAEKYVPRG